MNDDDLKAAERRLAEPFLASSREWVVKLSEKSDDDIRNGGFAEEAPVCRIGSR